MQVFKQLTKSDRAKISKLLTSGLSISKIAKRLGKNKSSISREIRRNGITVTPDDQIFWFCTEHDIEFETMKQLLREERKIPKAFIDWNAQSAQRQSDVRRLFSNRARREKSEETKKWIKTKLKIGWTPEQIAGRSKLEGPETVSHECIYQFVKKDRGTGGSLHRNLKRFHKRKQRFSKRSYNIRIPNRVGIEKRPSIVEKRARLGDLEADLIQGYRSDGYVLTLIDRFSRYVVLKKLESKKMTEVSTALKDAILEIGKAHTLTLDNGREFASHADISKATGVAIFFAKPYSTNDRASVENMNGLVRYYLPKKTPFKKVTDKKLQQIQNSLNHRPRKCLNFLTPEEVHHKF